MLKNNAFSIQYIIITFFFLLPVSITADEGEIKETVNDRPAPFMLTLTPAEKEWLLDHETIRVAGPRSFPPFHYYDRQNALKGISADYLYTILNQLGLKVEIHRDLPWQEVLKEAQTGKIDLIPCIAKTMERETYLRFSTSYLSFPLVIISRKNSTFIGGIEDLYGKRLATVPKISTEEWLKRDGVDFTPYYVESPLKALEAVSFGIADAHIENLAAASYLIQKHGLTNLKVAAPTPYGKYNLHMAVTRNTPELLSIINKTIDGIPPERHIEIRNKWLSIRYEHGITLFDVIKWVLAVVLFSGGVLMAFLLWNRRLKKEISERKRVELALMESEERFRLMVEKSPMGIAIVNNRFQYTYVNPEFCRVSGFPENELVGTEFYTLLDRKSKEISIERYLKRQKGEAVADRYEITFVTKSGEHRSGEVQSVVFMGSDAKMRSLIQVQDTTEQKKSEKENLRLEEQLRQIQKLEAVGTLAGGIAHDFNNMLGVIMGNVSYAISKITDDDVLFQALSDVQEGAKQARQLTQQLLTFSRGGAPIKNTADMNEILKESVQLASRGSDSTCEFDLKDELWPVNVDTAQINQAISNLIINAIQAMPGGGIIQIKTRNKPIDSHSPIPLDKGDFIHIEISDQGSGICEENISRIFEPFYTTKHQGNGLGLTTTFSIIKRHKGHISVKSKTGEGTRFDIYLPASEKSPLRSEGKESPGGKKHARILLMDDHEPMLDMTGRMLEFMGHEAAFAQDGAQAIEMYHNAFESETPFDLVILDLTVPGGMGGAETLPELFKINPKVKAVVSSGYAIDPIMAHYKDYGFCGVLPKPYTKEQLTDLLNDTLGMEG